MERRTSCFYCKKHSATIYCHAKGCRRSFHLPCGLKKNCNFQFHENFNSFCDKHCAIKDIATYQIGEQCCICYEYLEEYHPLKVLPICCQPKWTHIECMKRYALSAASEFKCILCSNRDDYKVTAQKRGVFIPNQDAAWEMEQNAYASLYSVYRRCDANNCLCKNGREYADKSSDNPWFIIVCRLCGGAGIHKRCSNKKNNIFKCVTCTFTSNTIAENVSRLTNNSRLKRKNTEAIELVLNETEPESSNLARNNETIDLTLDSDIEIRDDDDMPKPINFKKIEYCENWKTNTTPLTKTREEMEKFRKARLKLLYLSKNKKLFE